MWLLGFELRTFGRAVSAEPSLQPPTFYSQCGSEELQLRVAWSLQDADVPQCLAGAARLAMEGNTGQCRDRVLVCRAGWAPQFFTLNPSSQGTSDNVV